jgi:hypothetical protein
VFELQMVVFLICSIVKNLKSFVNRVAKIDTLLGVLNPKFIMVC